MAQGEFISVDEAAKSVGVTPRQIRNLIRSKQIVAQLIGGTYVIKRSDLAKVKDRKPGRPKKPGK